MQDLIKKLLWSIKNRFSKIYRSAQTFVVSAMTEKKWLLDWVPSTRADAHSIMLVRLDVIGDFILWLDSAKAYRSLYPNKKIVLYANAAWVELANQLSHWDEVVSIDMTKLRGDERYRLRTFYKIRRRGFNIAIQPTYSREYMGDMLARASGAEKRVGFVGDLSNILPAQKALSDQWYTDLIKSDPVQMMELNRNAEFIRALGLSDFVSDVYKLDLNTALPQELKVSEPYVVIFPGASWTPKMWPASNFAALIKEIKAKTGILPVLCGGPDEYELCQQVIRTSGLANVKNFAGKTKLTELVGLIKHAQFVFANDTSAIHIAAATGTPSVCILGGGHYGRFLPYEIEKKLETANLPKIAIHKMDCFHCNWHCSLIKQNTDTVPCVKNVQVEEVFKMYTILNEEKADIDLPPRIKAESLSSKS
jgi:ADP-heptose:LPS heptosyltransferase